MKFRFEPTLFLQTISAALAFGVTFGLDFLTDQQAGAIVAALAAVFGVLNAVRVRPVAPAAFTTLVTTGAALLTTYGLQLPAEQVGAFQLLVVAVVTYLTRAQVTPAAVGNPTVPERGTIA